MLHQMARSPQSLPANLNYIFDPRLTSDAHELHTAAVLLVQPYQLSGTIFQLQSLSWSKQFSCIPSSTQDICLLLRLKTVVNCNVASASVSSHAFSFMALYKFVFNFNFTALPLARLRPWKSSEPGKEAWKGKT